MREDADEPITTLLTTARDETIDRVVADPPLACRVVGRPDDEAPERQRRLRAGRGLFGRLFGAASDAPALPALTFVAGERRTVDLADSLTALDGMLVAVAGDRLGPGIELSGLVVGSGPVFAYYAREVHACHLALAAVSDADLRAHLVPEHHPARFGPGVTRDDVWLWASPYLAAWRAFLERASDERMGMLVHYGP